MQRRIGRRTYNSVHKRRKKIKKFMGSANGRPVLSVIIPAMNEQKTIAAVIREAWRVHPACEVIVVANGCRDRTATIASAMGAKVLRYEEPLGHDVGRTVGTQAARGDILLYLDGDMKINSAQLRPFVQAILDGTDVALNRYNGPINRPQVHPVILAKHTLNTMVSRSDLLGASMTAVPHALSRHAVEALGTESLSVPPLAQTMAAFAGLKIAAVHEVPVGKLNRRRVKENGKDPLQQVVISDHLQALQWYLLNTDSRGGRSDLERERNLVRR